MYKSQYGIVDPYSLRDHEARIQFRPLAAVSKRSAPQLNDLATLAPGCVEVQMSGSLLHASCLISEFRFLMCLHVCNKDYTPYIIITINVVHNELVLYSSKLLIITSLLSEISYKNAIGSFISSALHSHEFTCK